VRKGSPVELNSTTAARYAHAATPDAIQLLFHGMQHAGTP
jgi:hypothetical protein